MNQLAPVQTLGSSQYPQPSDNFLIDEETGFLYQPLRHDGLPRAQAFSLEKKKEFVDVYKAMFPDLTGACAQVGVSTRTYYWHLKIDKAFNEVIMDMRAAKADKVESVLFQVACMPKPAAFMDRIAFLRAYRPELYLERRVNLTAKDIDPRSLEHKAQAMGSVIDAEIIESGTQGPRSVIPSQEGRSDEPGNKQKENPGPNS